MSSGLECEIALKVIESYNLPVLVGIHLKDSGQLPSGEKVINIVKKYKNNKLRVDVKLTDTECLIYLYRKLH